MVDDLSRNNWVIVIIIFTAIALISTNIFLFNGMLISVANHIDGTVDNAAKNMTKLTSMLIITTKEGTLNTDLAVKNQTRDFVRSMSNFTNVIIDYSGQNDKNLKNISNILADIKAGNST